MYLYEYCLRSKDGKGIVIQLTHEKLFTTEEYHTMVIQAQKDTTDILEKQILKVKKKLMKLYGFKENIDVTDIEYGCDYELMR